MRFYGNKTKLLDFIQNVIQETTNLEPNEASFFDPFTGTTSVARHFKRLGYTVYASDFLNLAHVLAKAYIEINQEPKFKKFIKKYDTHPLRWLNNLDGKTGFITKNYSPLEEGGRKYVSVKNAQKIDVI